MDVGVKARAAAGEAVRERIPLPTRQAPAEEIVIHFLDFRVASGGGVKEIRRLRFEHGNRAAVTAARAFLALEVMRRDRPIVMEFERAGLG